MNRRIGWILVALMLGLGWAVAVQMVELSLLIAPLWWVGNGLRWLSLLGGACNVAAWCIFGVVTALPMLYLLFRWRNRTKSDWLLPLLSVQIAALLYFLVNPTLQRYPGDLPLADGFALVYFWALVATLVGYIFLHTLHKVNRESTSGRRLPKLLTLSGLVLVALTGYNHLTILFARIDRVTDANTGDVTFTIVTLSILAFLELLPAVLAGVTLLWGGDVADGLMYHPYEADTVVLCSTTAKRCSFVAIFAILVTLFSNIIQLLLASQLFQANIDVQLPLLTLLLSATLYLLCHYVQGAKDLSDDNESII